MSKIKVAFFDVDGTVVDNNKGPHKHSEIELVPKSTIEAIQKLKANGVTPFIATGRAPFMIESLLEGLGIDSYICMNGQYAVTKGEVIFENRFSEELLSRIEAVAKERELPLLWMPVSQYILSGDNKQYVTDALVNMNLPEAIIKDEMSVSELPIYQMVVGMKVEHDHAFSEIKDVRELRWQPTAIDLIPTGSSKASTITHILEKLNLKPENAIAFGDGLNDMEMLEVVGIGVAMGNAHEKTKSYADFVSRSVSEDGIEYALKHFNLI